MANADGCGYCDALQDVVNLTARIIRDPVIVMATANEALCGLLVQLGRLLAQHQSVKEEVKPVPAESVN